MLLNRQGINLIVWLVVFFVIITSVLALRFVAARINRRSLRIDDCLILVTYARIARHPPSVAAQLTVTTDQLTCFGWIDLLGRCQRPRCTRPGA